MCNYYSYFTDEETGTERLTNGCKITKLVSRFNPRKSHAVLKILATTAD